MKRRTPASWNTYQRIQAAKERNENDLIVLIRAANKQGIGYEHRSLFFRSMAEYHAEERLEQRGVIMFNARGRWSNPKRGWWLTSMWRKANSK